MKIPMANRLWALGSVSFFSDFIFGATFIFVMQEGGVTADLIGVYVAGTVVVSRLVEAPSGAWGDRYGQRGLIILGLLLWGAGFLLFALTPHPLFYVPALLLWSSGAALYSGAPTSLVVNSLREAGNADVVPRVLRGDQVTRWLASAAGAATVALAGTRVPPAEIVLVAGCLLVAAALWVALTWPRSGGDRQLGVTRNMLDGIRATVTGARLGVLWLTLVYSAAISVLIMSWQPVVAGFPEFGGSRASALGLTLLLFSLTAALGAWLGRRPKALRAEYAVLASVICLLGFLLLVGGGVPRTAVGYLGAEVLVGTGGTLLAVHSHAVIPDELRNTVTSMLSTAAGLSMAAADLVFGYLWDAFGPVRALHYCAWGLLALTALLALWTLIPREPHDETAEMSPLHSTHT
ncbi:MFS transporter [Streptomyces sp. NPDC020379]|uniref:MFS transporter n=1 Tax=Streptomyces sp. NPDC020379 TaxID=3365071 RepID=UPI00379AA620